MPLLRDLGVGIDVRWQVGDVADRYAAQDDRFAVFDERVALDRERVGRSGQQQEEQQRRQADQSASAFKVMTASASLSVAPSLR